MLGLMLTASIQLLATEVAQYILDDVFLVGEFPNTGEDQAMQLASKRLDGCRAIGNLHLYAPGPVQPSITVCYALKIGPGNLISDCILVNHQDVDGYRLLEHDTVLLLRVKQSLLGKRNEPEVIVLYRKAGFSRDLIEARLGMSPE
jgi:hypothetical protein